MVEMIQGLWTLVVLVGFLAVVVWAYHPRNREGFEQAARIALDDDADIQDKPATEKNSNG